MDELASNDTRTSQVGRRSVYNKLQRDEKLAENQQLVNAA